MLALRRALLALLALGVVFAGLDVAITLVSRHEPHKLVVVVFQAVIGLSFVGVGISAWWRRPLNRFGLLMTMVGFAWFLAGLAEANSSGLFTFGSYLGPLYIVVAVHMVLAFPSGRRWSSRASRSSACCCSPSCSTPSAPTASPRSRWSARWCASRSCRTRSWPAWCAAATAAP